MLRALSIPNNGLDQFDLQRLSISLKEDVVLTSLDISNNPNIGLRNIGQTLLDYGLTGMTLEEIQYDETRKKNWKLMAQAKTLCGLLMQNKRSSKCLTDDLMRIVTRRKSEVRLDTLVAAMEELLPRLADIGKAGAVTNELLGMKTKEEGYVNWKELLRFLHYVRLPNLNVSRKDERTGKEAQCRNQGLIQLKMERCTEYTSGRLSVEEKKTTYDFSLSLKRLFENNQHLTSIDLSRNRLDDTTAESICAGLSMSPVVVSLILSKNRFSKASLPYFTAMVKRCQSLDKLNLSTNPMLFDSVQNKNDPTKEDVKCATRLLGGSLGYLDVSETGLTPKAALNLLRSLLTSENVRVVHVSRNRLREISTVIATKIIPDLAKQGVTSLKRLVVENIQMLQSEAKILLTQLAAAPEDCDLIVVGHGLEGAAEMRAGNERRKDMSGEKLKCADCKSYKFMNHFLKPNQLEGLGPQDFAKYVQKSMRGYMRCLICAKKRKDALDRAMGRTIQMIKYGISAPRTKVVSSLFRMNQFVSPEAVKQRNIVLAKSNSNLKAKALSSFNASMLD